MLWVAYVSAVCAHSRLVRVWGQSIRWMRRPLCWWGWKEQEPGHEQPEGHVRSGVRTREDINLSDLRFPFLTTWPSWYLAQRPCSRLRIYFGDKEEPPKGFLGMFSSLHVPFSFPNVAILVRSPLTTLFKTASPLGPLSSALLHCSRQYLPPRNVRSVCLFITPLSAFLSL